MDELEQLVELRKQHLENNEKVLKEYDKQIELLTHQKRKNWLKTITDEQKNLLDRIYDLNESLFCDLTRDELLEEERIDQFGGSDYTDDLFSKTMVFIDPTLSCEGECDFKDNTLRFHPDHLLLRPRL